MKYSDNYGFNLPESSDAADISKLNENFESIDELIAGMLNLAWPVGTLYWSSEPTDPGVLFPGTTWTRIKDKFILAAGDTYEAGTTGGSANAIVVSHSHTVSGTAESAGTHTHVITATSSSAGAHTHTVSGSAASSGAHTHTVSGSATSAGAHTHTVSGSAASSGAHYHGMGDRWSTDTGSNRAYVMESKRKAEVFNTSSAGAHTHTVSGSAASAGAHTHTVSGSAASAGAHTHTISGTAESDGAHTHTITVSETSAGVHTHTVSGTTAASGVSGTGKNMPPYEVYYCWKRTA